MEDKAGCMRPFLDALNDLPEHALATIRNYVDGIISISILDCGKEPDIEPYASIYRAIQLGKPSHEDVIRLLRASGCSEPMVDIYRRSYRVK